MHADDRLGDLRDDRRAARRADGEPDAAVRAVDDRRAHRAARPLAALDAVGDRARRSSSGIEAEIGQLVVEIIAVDHQPRAEAAFDRRGFRSDIAPAVDRDEVRGAALLRLTALAQHCRARRRGVPALGRPRSSLSGEISAERLREIGRVDQPGDAARGRNPRRRDIGRGRRKRAARFGDQVPGVGESRPERRQVEPLELLQDREHGRPARRGRAHAADPVGAVRAAHRRSRLRVDRRRCRRPSSAPDCAARR